MKRILFFTPYGLLNGSGVLLWNILHHFDRQCIRAAVYCAQPGPLTATTPSDVVMYQSPYNRNKISDLLLKSVNALGYNVYEKHIERIHHEFKPDYWYLNTVLMFHLTPLAKRLGVPVIAHINELNSMYESISYTDMQHAITHSAITVGITKHICDLAAQMGARQTFLQHCFTNPLIQSISHCRVAELKQQQGIDEVKFVWLMAGTPIYRKGIDFLPAIAKALSTYPCHIIWMGTNPIATGLNYLVEKQIETLSSKNVTFLGIQTDDYSAYLQMADGFVMTSREEPFGNVLIDAASLGKPIVASGEYGASEFILPGMGELTEYTLPQFFVAAMIKVMTNLTAYDPDKSISQSLKYDAQTQVALWQKMICALP